MQRVREGGGCQLIGFDAFQRIGGLERKTDVMEVKRFQDPQMILCGFDHRFFGVLVFPVQASGIDADTYGHVSFFAEFNDLFDLIFILNVARIETDLVGSRANCLQGEIGIEVDIADQRDTDLFLDLFYGFGILHIEDRDTDDLTACIFELADLFYGRFYVFGLGVGHRLDHDFVLSADLYTADIDGSGFSSVHIFILHQKKPQICFSKALMTSSTLLSSPLRMAFLTQLSMWFLSMRLFVFFKRALVAIS